MDAVAYAVAITNTTVSDAVIIGVLRLGHWRYRQRNC
jgi:hypothetical protein